MFEYRECNERDCTRWIEMNRAFMREEIREGDVWNEADQISDGEFREIFMKGLQMKDRIRFLMFEEDEEPVGFANLMLVYSVWSHGTAMIIDDFYFTIGNRGKGYGKRATEMITDFARNLGCRRLQLQAEFTNPDAIEFYKAVGFLKTDMEFFVKYLDGQGE